MHSPFGLSVLIGTILFLLVAAAVSYVTNPLRIAQDEIKCTVGGCSGELCYDANDKSAPTASICIWSSHYACYRTAKCQKQTNGKCGWNATNELNRCIANGGTP